MANYYENSTSNEFKVKKGEKERLEKIFKNLIGEDVQTNFGELGEDIYAWFGCYGVLTGLDVENYFEGNEEMIEKYKDDEYNAMVDELQKCVAEDDYIMFMDAGHEKLRYVNGGALIITFNHSEYISLDHIARKRAMELLGVYQE